MNYATKSVSPDENRTLVVRLQVWVAETVVLSVRLELACAHEGDGLAWPDDGHPGVMVT